MEADMPKMSLKLLIDTQNQKVIFAEADQKAIDFLSHFLALPMPTLLNLLDERKMFGCLANLSQRDTEEALVNPRIPVGYTCNGAHNYFSHVPASVCPECSETMLVKMTYVAPPAPKGSATGTYMIMDDLVVNPVLSAVSAFASLSKFNLKVDFASLEEKVVDFGLYEALELLKTSLSISNKVLTTVFLKSAGKENPSDDVREQFVCALGNLAVDSQECRDLVLEHEALAPSLLAQLNDEHAELSTLRNATQTVSKICSGALESDKVSLPVFENEGNENLKVRVTGFWSNDGNTQLESIIYLKDLLSIDDINIPPIQEVVQTGVVPRLVELLERDDFPQLQSEATWVLQVIACGTADHSKAVIDHGAVPRLVKLLSSPSHDVREQAVCALGNIAVDSQECRDLVLAHGALAPVLAKLNDDHAELSTLRNATWALSKICSGGLESDQARLVLPVLKKLVMNSNDKEVLSEACFTLSCLSDGNIQAVIDSGVCPQLIQLLQHPSPDVLLHALKTVGYIVSGDDSQVQYILDCSYTLPHLRKLLRGNYNVEIKRDACWTIANITGASRDQIWGVIDSGISSALINLLQSAESIEIKEMAGLAISNAVWGRSSYNQIRRLVRQGCITPLCDLLVCPHPDIVTPCLRGLKRLVKVEQTDYVQMIIDAGGLEKLWMIAKHGDSYICKKLAKFIISKISE